MMTLSELRSMRVLVSCFVLANGSIVELSEMQFKKAELTIEDRIKFKENHDYIAKKCEQKTSVDIELAKFCTKACYYLRAMKSNFNVLDILTFTAAT